MLLIQRRTLHAFICAAIFCVAAGYSAAQPLSPLNEGDRAQWQAVGRVNTTGYVVPFGCSGTLIAPDLVVTAAHCVVGANGAKPKQHFIAGWYRGHFTAHRVARDVLVHPLYKLTQGPERLAFDVALLVLEDPIPTGLLAPIPLHGPALSEVDPVLVLGYENAHPHALSGRTDCPMTQASHQYRIYACEVRNGASGGAVIAVSNDGAALSGVIVARDGTTGHALTVPVSQWARDKWYQALDRDKRRR